MKKAEFLNFKFYHGMEFMAYRTWKQLCSVDFDNMEVANEFGTVFCISEIKMIKNKEGEIVYNEKA